MSVRRTIWSFSAPETTTILKVDPGSMTSVMTRLRRASASRAGIVRIEIRQRRHGQDFAGARPNHDARNADRRVLFHRLGQRRLRDVLDHGINGEHDVQAVARLDVLFAQGDQFAAAAVGFGHPPAARAGQFGVQRQLDVRPCPSFPRRCCH